MNIDKINSVQLTNEQNSFYNDAYKYPLIASEFLSSEIPVLLDKFLPLETVSNLEESKFNFLNLSSESLNSSEIEGSNIILVDEIKKDNLYFNPPEIEYAYDLKDKDISLNMSLDRRMTTSSLVDNTDLLDYLFGAMNLFNINNAEKVKIENCNYNPILSGYFAKIIVSFIKARPAQIIKYLRSKRSEILITLIEASINTAFAEIVIKLLLVDNLNLEESNNFDNLKIYIVCKILNLIFIYYENFEELTNLVFTLTEYIDYTKNLDILLVESFLTGYITFLQVIKDKTAIKQVLSIGYHLMVQFKIEYEKAQKFLSSLSMSTYFLTYMFIYKI